MGMISSSTGLDLITDVLTTIGELAQGQTPSPEDAIFCQRRLNGALDSMSQEEGYVFTRNISAYDLTPLTGTYVIGPTAAAPFNVARPTKIELARILALVGGQYVGIKEMRIITYAEYVSYSDKTSTSIVPEELYYDNAAPNGNLYLFDIPSAANTRLELTTLQQLPQLESLTDTLDFPEGYYEPLVLILGVAVSPAYNKAVDQVTAGRMTTCSDRIKAINRSILFPGIPPQQQPGAAQPGQQPAPPKLQ